ncbi:protein RIC-3-like [Pristis pectinata]|uniref:protein RIC-3-like n=1 Tax=Pristis pectinata TaxID=685728 RepID=UPI00223E25D4|nr:protein RIC-3-like [Pristis pectinata]
MGASAFQKVALISCVVVCCSVIFPRVFVFRPVKEQSRPQEARPTRLSPMAQHLMVSKSKQQWSARPHLPKSHQYDSIAKVKGGNGGGSNRSFMSQIIPVYGFGLLMYILYILFKISSKGSTQSPRIRKRCAGTRLGNMKCKITDYELAQLQAKLKETEVAMKQIASKMGNGSDTFRNDTSEQEENLLRQLKEITRVMKEQKFIEGIGPEKETEESPCMEHCEGYPEETAQPRCSCQHDINYSESNQLSAEELEDKIEDKCLSSKTTDDKIRQNQKCQALNHQKGAHIGIDVSGDGIKGEDLQYEDWKYLVHESDDSAVMPEEVDISSEDHCNVGGQIRDESSLDPYDSELQPVITYNDEGALRKRNKMAIE